MTVGEKIQVYRKRIGLSQEELGQKMLVSRQTISLWEMDKTLPTVDNLIRLKEIFSVSLDDLLSEDEPARAIVPQESYTFQYEQADLRAVFRKTYAPILKRAIMIVIACGLMYAFLTATEADGTIVGLLSGCFLACFLIVMISCAIGYGTWKNAESRVLQSTYAYDVFDGYFVVNISRNGEAASTAKISFSDIGKIQELKNHLVLQIAGQSYILKKEALRPDSVFLTICADAPAKQPKDKLHAISILLFVLSIGTIWGALFAVAARSADNHAMTENMWTFFWFLPIPIASIAFGVYLKKKGRKYKKNIIVGVIMAALLCIYGSFAFLVADVYTHDDAPILRAEQMLDIDIPVHTRINTQDWTQGVQLTTRGLIYATSDIYFDDAAVEAFENGLSTDPKWICAIPNEMIGITSYFCDVWESDYYILYNRDTGEFNTLPSESGTYAFLNVLYHAESNTMKLVEYEIEYIK